MQKIMMELTTPLIVARVQHLVKAVHEELHGVHHLEQARLESCHHTAHRNMEMPAGINKVHRMRAGAWQPLSSTQWQPCEDAHTPSVLTVWSQIS